MHTPLLINLTRRREGLLACVNLWAQPQSMPSLQSVPLEALGQGVYRQRDAVLADWASLGQARELADAWPAFWRLFWASRPESPATLTLAAAPAPAVAARAQATAAHPRAYRGTKYQPPKVAARSLDLQAWLADSRLLDAFFASHDFAALPSLGPDGRRLDCAAPPTVASLYGEAVGLGQVAHAFGRDTTHAWLLVWRALGAPTQGPLLALLSRLCALAPAAASWAELALAVGPSRRPGLLRCVLLHRSYLLDSGLLTMDALAALDAETASDERFGHYLDALLGNLNRGVSSAYTLAGCRLAHLRDDDQFQWYALRAERDSADVPMEEILQVARLCDPWRTLNVWKLCARGYGRILRDTDWQCLGKAAADEWIDLFTRIDSDQQEEARIAKRWQVYLDASPAWLSGLHALSGAAQERYARVLCQFAGGWEDVTTLAEGVSSLQPLIMRLCAGSGTSQANLGWVLGNLAEPLRPGQRLRLAGAGARSWAVLDQACRRDDHATLIMRGLYHLARRWPAATLEAFERAPSRLFASARLLGCLAYERRRQFLAQAVHGAWFDVDWAGLAPALACRQLRVLCAAAGIDSPLPRRLRQHFDGETVLSVDQVARHCRVTLARLPALRLRALDGALWRALDAPFNLRRASVAASHAVRLLAGIDSNRHGLRKVLLAYGQGQPDAYLAHPLNLAWLARHRRLDPQRWYAGTRLSLQLQGGPVTLATETDPLEILMLGTYVGSCLGLGGLCDYSAVACMLDANKRVVYARDAQGRVLARQLLAIDEQDRLVGFDVYPSTADPALIRAFHDHADTLARQLGLERYEEHKHGAYQVAIVLAESWWDDGMGGQAEHDGVTTVVND